MEVSLESGIPCGIPDSSSFSLAVGGLRKLLRYSGNKLLTNVATDHYSINRYEATSL